ncbi:MAG: hypothetical protein JO044_07690 [Mycobacteriaceae bacterium]|nr:hypothetical protein [Mycobacteriaceae bacterium]MBV9641723.1 hypothetical protein [Mycobacteriaceae bacterium]
MTVPGFGVMSLSGFDHPWWFLLGLAPAVAMTVAVAGPTHELRQPRNRAVIMPAIDVSQSMRAADVSPGRLAAAQQAAEHFADQLTPGVMRLAVLIATAAACLAIPLNRRLPL